MLRTKIRLVFCLALGSWTVSEASAQAPVKRGDISAPLAYENTMLVLVSEEGAAAVIFRGVGGGSASYDYRYESKDGSRTEAGTRALSERREPAGNLGGELYIKAGPISVGWSRGSDTSGWIYYTPEKVKVHLANAKDFADRREPIPIPGDPERLVPKLDLKRFLK